MEEVNVLAMLSATTLTLTRSSRKPKFKMISSIRLTEKRS